MSLRCMVIGILVDAAYEEKAYGYLIIISTEANYLLTVMDGFSRTHEADLGTTRDVDIIALLPTTVEKIDRCEPKAIPSPYQHDPHAEFYARIVDIIKSGPKGVEFVIDIGKGTVNVDPYTYSRGFSMLADGSALATNGTIFRKGDYVHIANPRLDLRSIKPASPT